jgi:hypothetical protein
MVLLFRQITTGQLQFFITGSEIHIHIELLKLVNLQYLKNAKRAFEFLQIQMS